MTLGRNLIWRAALVWAIAMTCSATAQVPTPSAPAATAPSTREAEIAAAAFIPAMEIARIGKGDSGSCQGGHGRSRDQEVFQGHLGLLL